MYMIVLNVKVNLVGTWFKFRIRKYFKCESIHDLNVGTYMV
jgi:hypothetical protein